MNELLFSRTTIWISIDSIRNLMKKVQIENILIRFIDKFVKWRENFYYSTDLATATNDGNYTIFLFLFRSIIFIIHNIFSWREAHKYFQTIAADHKYWAIYAALGRALCMMKSMYAHDRRDHN